MKLLRNIPKLLLGLILLFAASYLVARYIYEPIRFRAALGDILGINDDEPKYLVYPLGEKRILELATIEQPLIIQGFARKGIWPVDSSLFLQGLFTIKVGFDFNEYAGISYDWANKHAVVHVPQPKVLSVELKKLTVPADEQTVFSSFSAKEQADFNNEMQKMAAEAALSDFIMDSAVKNLTRQLEAIAATHRGTVEIVVQKRTPVDTTTDIEQEPAFNQPQ